MFETLGFETLTPLEAALIFGLLTGAAFGALAELTRFCFRRSLVGPEGDRRAAMGVWMTALAAALLGTQAAVALGLVSFTGHRFHAPALPALAIVTGGLLFGAGMVLTRGCASRLTVLAGSGNLRAALVLLAFAVTAHATLRGALAPLRTTLASVTIPLGETTSLAALPGGAALWTALLAAAALLIAARSGARPRDLALAVPLGLLVPLAWVTTGLVLQDDFDPIPMESLSFTAPWAEALFWTVAATSIAAGFGAGLVGGTLAGALAASLAGRRFRWQSFETPRQTGRYLLGAVLMGMGGVLAGGCTVGAGLGGIPTLSLAALLALASIAAGARLTDRVVDGARTGRAVAAR
jgi:uncharacterized protein